MVVRKYLTSKTESSAVRRLKSSLYIFRFVDEPEFIDVFVVMAADSSSSNWSGVSNKFANPWSNLIAGKYYSFVDIKKYLNILSVTVFIRLFGI